MKRLRTTILATLMLVFGAMAPAHAAVAPVVGAWAPISVTYGTGAVALQAPTSNSTGAWSFTSSNPSVASVVGSTLSINAVGTATLVGTQAATTDYLAATATTTVTVNPAAPTIGPFGPFAQSLQSHTFTIAPPTSTSGGAWTFASSNPAIASVSGNVVTLTGVGVTVITASQAANWNWAAASATALLTVSGLTPTVGPWPALTLTFGSVGGVTLVPPTSPSSGAWTYAVANPAVATVAGNLLTLTGVGSTIITASQAAYGNYSAVSVTRSLTVQGGPPTLGGWPDLKAALQPFSGNTVVITPPTSNSTGAWVFTSSDSTTVSIAGNLATLLKPGSVLVTGVQSAAGMFGPSAPDTMTLTVVAATPPLSTWPSLQKAAGAGDFVLVPPTSPSAGSWTYASSDTAVATVVGATVHLVGAGQAAITAIQQPNWYWGPAQATMTLTVLGVAPTVGVHVPMAIGIGDAFAIPAATSTSSGPWTYTSSDPTIARISGVTVTGLRMGTVTVTAVQGPSGAYSQSAPITFSVTVAPHASVGNFANISTSIGAAAKRLSIPTSTSNGSWSFSSSAPDVVSVLGATLTFHAAGSATITAVQAATPLFAATTRSFTVSVTGRQPRIGPAHALIVTYSKRPVILHVPTSTSSGAWTFSLGAGNRGSIVAGRFLPLSAGMTTLTMTQAAWGGFMSTKVTVRLTVLPRVTVKLAPHAIRVSAVGGPVLVRIAGKVARLGVNRVRAGRHAVRVTYGANVVYDRILTVR